jgi:hypothetical protein
LSINLAEGEDKRFELPEPAGRVFKAPGTNLRLIKNVLDNVKRDLGNRPISSGFKHLTDKSLNFVFNPLDKTKKIHKIPAKF